MFNGQACILFILVDKITCRFLVGPDASSMEYVCEYLDNNYGTYQLDRVIYLDLEEYEYLVDRGMYEEIQ